MGTTYKFQSLNTIEPIIFKIKKLNIPISISKHYRYQTWNKKSI
jgi:hypothetical protein